MKRSTFIAGITATAILVFVVLPSEYAIDPTGVGGLLGLTTMGEIKVQLAEESAQDAASATAPLAGVPPQQVPNLEIAERLSRIEGMLVQLAESQMLALPADTSPQENVEATIEEIVPPEPVQEFSQPVVEERFAEIPAEAPVPSTASEWRDELSFTLTPGEGKEIKLVMQEGERAEFYWTANGGVVNYETHGDGGGNNVSYEKGRAVPEQQGFLEPTFTGNHGWFWRNRTDADVTMTLRTRGGYSAMKQ